MIRSDEESHSLGSTLVATTIADRVDQLLLLVAEVFVLSHTHLHTLVMRRRLSEERFDLAMKCDQVAYTNIHFA